MASASICAVSDVRKQVARLAQLLKRSSARTLARFCQQNQSDCWQNRVILCVCVLKLNLAVH